VVVTMLSDLPTALRSETLVRNDFRTIWDDRVLNPAYEAFGGCAPGELQSRERLGPRRATAEAWTDDGAPLVRISGTAPARKPGPGGPARPSVSRCRLEKTAPVMVEQRLPWPGTEDRHRQLAVSWESSNSKYHLSPWVFRSEGLLG
jgi:hypothetical protein